MFVFVVFKHFADFPSGTERTSVNCSVKKNYNNNNYNKEKTKEENILKQQQQ